MHTSGVIVPTGLLRLQRFAVAVLLIWPFLLISGCDIGEEVGQGPWDHLLTPGEGDFRHLSSYDTTGGNRDRYEIAAGDSVVLLDLEGPGVLRRIWITVSSRDPHFEPNDWVAAYLQAFLYSPDDREAAGRLESCDAQGGGSGWRVGVPPEDSRSGRRASLEPISMTVSSRVSGISAPCTDQGSRPFRWRHD